MDVRSLCAMQPNNNTLLRALSSLLVAHSREPLAMLHTEGPMMLDESLLEEVAVGPVPAWVIKSKKRKMSTCRII